MYWNKITWKKKNSITNLVWFNICADYNWLDITDADYMHAKRVCKDIEIKELGQYHHFYL